MVAALDHAQGVKVGGQMAPDAVGADDHDGADAVQHSRFDLRRGQRNALFGGLFGDPFGGPLGDGRLGPFTGQRRGIVVIWHNRPVGARPGRACGLTLGVQIAVAKVAEKRGPIGIDTCRISGKLVDVIGVGPVKERACAELGVGGLFGHVLASGFGAGMGICGGVAPTALACCGEETVDRR